MPKDTRVLHLAFIFIQARGRCTSPPNPCSKPAQARSGCTTPPPALLVSSSCTTHHPLPQSLNIHHPQLTFRPWKMHHPPQLFPFHRKGGVHHPPPAVPIQGWGGAPPPPAVPIQGGGGTPRAIDGWRRFCGTTSCACISRVEWVKVSRYM